MQPKQQFSITLPEEVAEVVRAKVAAGEYFTESEVILEGLRMLIAHDHAIEQWLCGELAAAYDEIKAYPAKILTAEQVRASLAARRA